MKRKFGLGMLIIVFAIFLSACSININGNVGMNKVRDLSEKTMEGANVKELLVVSSVGKVEVTTWDRDEVYVQVTKINNGFKDKAELLDELENAEVIFSEEGDRITVKTYLPKFKNNGISVELDISVPERLADVRIESEVGDIAVAGINGQVEVVNNVGKIGIEDCSARMDLKAITGDVQVRRSSLKGDSILISNVGRVQFDGEIDREGTYRMTTNVGALEITLPGDAAFDIDASTNIGEVKCRFEVDGTEKNSSIYGTVNGGGPKLILVNNTGSIDIDRR